MDQRWSDVGRFLTGDKKLPTSGRGQSEGLMRVGEEKGELAMRVEYHMQVRSYSCFQDILCKKFMCLCDVSVGKVMCTYEGRMSANFLPEINNCQCLAIVGEIGRRKS